MPVAQGTRLGPYEILSSIGAGGMGEVYRARDTRLGRDVAVKIVSTEFSARFQNEARAIAALNHPNICTLHDVGPNYLVMELVEGDTLADRLTNGPLSTPDVVRLAIEVAEALAAAHAKGMAHRDLKPGNVMVTPQGRVKLLDFGLAKMLDADPELTHTVDGAILGTFAYMSPEQLRGEPAGPASDIFTFGAVLYEMLSGRRAFHGAGVRHDPPPLTGVGPDLSAIVTRCLRQPPEERYRSMAEVKAALERISVAPAEAGPSIAVLPFANMSGDKENEYFSDGLAEEILNALARVEGLKVTARTSAFAFRGERLDIRRIGESLGVRTVLEGSVRRAGNRIRITAQLINVTDGYHLWSERYDRDMTDVFVVQDEIAAAIVKALSVKLGAVKPAPRPVNIEAYDALLKARHAMSHLTPQNIERAIAYADEAIRLDPEYSLAYIGRAVCLMAGTVFGAMPVRDALPVARAAALRALELDPSQQESAGVLAIAAACDYDWVEARRHCPDAGVEDIGIIIVCVTSVLLPLDRCGPAIHMLERAISRDPLHPGLRAGLAQAYTAAGDLSRAEKEARRILELHQKEFVGYMGLGALFTVQRRTEDAIAILEDGTNVAPWNLQLWALLAVNYHRAGNPSRAEALLMQPQFTSAAGHPIVDVARGTYYAVIGEFDRAADFLDRAAEAHHFMVLAVAWSPLYRDFRQTPHGRALLAKMNLGDVVRGNTA